MTHTTTDAAEARALSVIQADRLAAAKAYFNWTAYSTEEIRDEILAGLRDEGVTVQAFARHRLATAEAASGAGLQANTMDIVEGVCGTLKPRVIGYDPLNSFVVTNMARWLVPALSDGAHTWEDADETMQERADAAAKAVIAEIQEDMCNTAPIEAASGAGEREELAAFGASEAAGYQYPGADQAAERAAFCAGAAHAASLPPATDPAIPAGWKLVPTEPTQQQHNAGNMAQDDVDQTDARAIYRAMLAAAPTIPATGEAVRKGMTAEWCLNMARLEEGQEVGAGMPDHPLRLKCELPPAGWLCTREPGHVGPCATIPATGHAATEGEGA